MLLGGTGLGKPRSPANQVGQEAADELIESCSRKVCLDQYAQDQVSFILFFSVWNFGCRTLSQPNDCLIGDYFHGLGWRYFKSFGGTTELAHAYSHPCDFSTDRSKSNYCPRSACAMTTFLRHDQDCVMTDF